MSDLTPTPSKLKYLDTFSDLLDSRFRIPGTDIRFGLDFLIGLVPYAGDLLSFVFSGGLIIAMAKNGASGIVLLKMIWNIFLDTTVGSIPIIGDLFDLGYKSNRRNFNLLKEHYDEGKHTGSAWPAIILVGVVLMVLFAFFIWLLWKIATLGLAVILGGFG